jgi:minor extracellular protease Epr
LDSLAELKKRLPVRLHNQLDRNHIYIPQVGSSAGSSAVNSPTTTFITGASKIPNACEDAISIGIIDTAINTTHPAFAHSQIITKDFAGEDFDAPRAHGTAVAGLLVGRGEQLTPLLPAAKLFAASVFYPRNEYAQGATMMNLVRALDWLAAGQVAVINMSLAGPDNKILGIVVNKIIDSGIAIVAAAGNEGPAAPAVYPAAYENVIAVTAVDNQQRSYRWANRGDYIDFAAPGVGIFTARSSGDFGRESGTSMAAPVVAALFACAREQQKKLAGNNIITVQFIVAELIKKSLDLGDKGRDPVFGYGLLDVH